MITLKNIGKLLARGGDRAILEAIDLSIDRGEFVVLAGPSGAGKTALLRILGLLDRPSSGSYSLEGRETLGLGDRELAGLRSGYFGFLFRKHNLLPELDAVDNVILPMRYANMPRHLRSRRARELLERAGFAGRSERPLVDLDNEEMQRVAIARALANDPAILLADEPTGDLSVSAGKGILELLSVLNREGLTVLMATHDPSLASSGSRVIEMSEGRIQAQSRLGTGA